MGQDLATKKGGGGDEIESPGIKIGRKAQVLVVAIYQLI